MSSIVIRFLRSIMRLLPNRPNYLNAAELRDGDVAGETVQELVKRNIEEAKLQPHLKYLSHIDLSCSLNFLEQGVCCLLSFNESEPDQEAATDPTPEYQVETSRMSCVAESKILSEALECAIVKLKINYSSEFESAKYILIDARKKAKCAFSSTELDITDKILATKVRLISSRILQCLGDFETEISAFFVCLQDLHSLPDIREIFSKYLSRTSSDERVKIIKSVMLINYVFFEFNLQFSSSSEVTNMFTWPVTIELSNARSFNPILDWREVATRKSMGDTLSELDDPYKLLIDTKVIPILSAVDNRQLLVPDQVE